MLACIYNRTKGENGAFEKRERPLKGRARRPAPFETSGRKRCLPALTGSPAGPPLCEERRSWHEKLTALLLACALAFSLAACAGAGQGANASSQNSAPSAAQEAAGASSQPVESAGTAEGTGTEGQSNILVAYFSWADNAVIDGEVDAVASPSVTAPGNVQQLAQWISERTGGDLFSIQVTEPYSSDWDACLERANQERAEDARPELTASVEQLERYDTVFSVGYPNWWYGVPMALLSFLEENDLSDKQVYLFCSHGTGGLASSVEQIDEALPDSTALSENIFDVYEEDAASSQQDILAWLEELGY